MDYRGFLIQSDGTFGYKRVKPVGRGSVPNGLRGDFTTETMAKRAIDLEYNKKESGNGEGGLGN